MPTYRSIVELITPNPTKFLLWGDDGLVNVVIVVVRVVHENASEGVTLRCQVALARCNLVVRSGLQAGNAYKLG